MKANGLSAGCEPALERLERGGWKTQRSGTRPFDRVKIRRFSQTSVNAYRVFPWHASPKIPCSNRDPSMTVHSNKLVASYYRCRRDERFLDTFYDLFLSKS